MEYISAYEGLILLYTCMLSETGECITSCGDLSCRLLWGTAGASNALAVAEGLGFDPAVISEARRVAEHTRMITDTSLRNRLLADSLDEQLAESRVCGVSHR